MARISPKGIKVNFTSTSADYELLNDAGVKAKLLYYLKQEEIDKGFPASFTVFCSGTGIKVDNRPWYDVLTQDTLYGEDETIVKSIKIQNTGISGTLEIKLL